MKLITKEQADKLDKIAIDKHKILGTSLDWTLLEDSQINSMKEKF
jgi:hypothetical protein